MHVLALEMVLRLPDARTLKDRRQVVRSLVEAPRRRFEVAAAELDEASEPKHAVVGFCAISNSPSVVRERLGSVEDFVWSREGVEVLDTHWSWLES